MILVCSLSRVDEMVARYRPGRVISLLDPDYVFPDLGPSYGGKHLQLRFHDVLEAAAGEIAPSTAHIDHLLRFIRAAGRDESLLIHCRTGISRSTAAAFIASCCFYPDVPERTLALALRRASSVARPNQTMVALADVAMSRGGRMSEAISSTAEDIPWITLDEGQAFELRGPDRDT